MIMTKAEIIDLYSILKDPPRSANQEWFHDRGRKLEAMLTSLLRSEGLEPRIRYRPKGEEIDGSFLFASRIYLLEAKWQSSRVPASSLYSFKSKVDGKLVGTIGVFISMSGYSADAVDALVKGKELNLILFDQQDFELALSNHEGFSSVFGKKVRAASEEGLVYFPVSPREVQGKVMVEGFHLIEEPSGEASAAVGVISVVCEGYIDQVILTELLSRLVGDLSIKLKVSVLVAGGKQNIPKVANLLSGRSNHRTLIVTDGEFDKEGTINALSTAITDSHAVIIMPEPTLEEAWLGVSRQQIPFSANSIEFFVEINDRIKNIDFGSLIERDDAFRAFWNVLSGAGGKEAH